MPIPLFKLCPPAETLTPDSELLARFVTARDENAFAELVRRHGPVVYRICRRLVPAQADDAFQAVFLVLACRARRVRTPAAVGSWLVGVAGRVARQMRAAETRRSTHERRAGRPEASPAPEVGDLAAVLDEELAQLPAELRDPVILCLVSGRTHAQAAAALGSSVRTVRRRLERAAALLRARLLRRGVVPAVAAALVASAGESPGAVPPALVARAVEVVFQFLDGGAPPTAVVAVAKGVMDGMAKLKISALVATTAAVLVCIGVAWSQDQPPRIVPATAAGPDLIAVPPVVPPSAPSEVAAGVSFRSANFEVYAPTPVMARVIASEAEFHRRTYALKWLGKELPNWPERCVIRFTTGLGGNNGATTFTFTKGNDGNPVMGPARMEIRGHLLDALTDLLPHEVTHTVLASFFGRPLPRWADEGIALLSESDEEQARNDTKLRELLTDGRGMRLKVLLWMTNYPKDMIVPYTQGHSLARFLAGRTKGVPALKDIPHLGEMFKTGPDDGHRRLLAFVALGLKDNTAEGWGKAVKAVYGFDSVDALEEAWLEWLAKPESFLARKEGPTRPTPATKPGDGDFIPPVKLPTAPSGAPFNRKIGESK